MPQIHGTRHRFLGLDILTDHAPLAEMIDAQLDKAGDEKKDAIFSALFNKTFPGFTEAVIEGHRELGDKRLRPTMVTYFNFRVQVWALGFDADPSTVRRCLPSAVVDESSYEEPTVH